MFVSQHFSIIHILSFTHSYRKGESIGTVFSNNFGFSQIKRCSSFHHRLLCSGVTQKWNGYHDSVQKVLAVVDNNNDNGGNQNTSTDETQGGKPLASSVDCKRELEVYIFTFPELYPSDDGDEDKQSDKEIEKVPKHLRLLKRWKYYTLGDGGVYFDQRPKALLALNELFLDALFTNIFDQFYEIGYVNEERAKDPKLSIECAVISTCKRFEILVAIESNSVGGQKIRTSREKQVKNIIASCLAEQIMSHRRKLRLQGFFPFLPFLSLPLDRPSRIKFSSFHQYGNGDPRLRTMCDELRENIEVEIETVSDVHDVASRLINMASGLLDRPLFRPFSSRDAHIMAQIKRSAEGSSRHFCSHGSENFNSGESSQKLNNKRFGSAKNKNTQQINTTKYIKILFDSALQGGKAARSPKAVPILDQLRAESKGADGPPELSVEAAKSVEILVIKPTLIACIEKFRSMEFLDSVTTLRSDARNIAKRNGIDLDSDSGKAIRRILHQPTIDLRRGQPIDKAKLFQQIELEIESTKNNS